MPSLNAFNFVKSLMPWKWYLWDVSFSYGFHMWWIPVSHSVVLDLSGLVQATAVQLVHNYIGLVCGVPDAFDLWCRACLPWKWKAVWCVYLCNVIVGESKCDGSLLLGGLRTAGLVKSQDIDSHSWRKRSFPMLPLGTILQCGLARHTVASFSASEVHVLDVQMG